MPEHISLSQLIPTTPQRLYEAWLSSDEHSKMTGAAVSYQGAQFTAWDDYIAGKTIETKPYERIVQNWRTNEFPEGAGDSELIISLAPAEGGTLLTLEHRNLPEGQSEGYADGWRRFYFEPMTEYFGTPVAQFKEASEKLEGAVERAVEQASNQMAKVVKNAQKGAQKQAAKAVKSAKKAAKSVAKSVRAAFKGPSRAAAKKAAKPAKSVKAAVKKAATSAKKASPAAKKAKKKAAPAKKKSRR